MRFSTSTFIFIAILSALLNACTPVSTNDTPVTTTIVPISPNPPKPVILSLNEPTRYHQVRKNETLYSISQLFKLDYHQLAQWNLIAPPYTIRIGQKLRLSEPNLKNNPPPGNTNAPTIIPKTAEVIGQLPKPAQTQALNSQQNIPVAVSLNSADSQKKTPFLDNNPNLAKQPSYTPEALKNAIKKYENAIPKPLQSPALKSQQNIPAEVPINRTDSQKKAPYFLDNKPNPVKQQSYTAEAYKNAIRKYENAIPKKPIISIDNRVVLKLSFQWPIKGKVLKAFSQTNNKGIDIAGEVGQEVYAAEAGKVVYSGQSLIGYGNLMIIKHNNLYLSTYGNNGQMLVAEGSSVKKGDVIAKIGQTKLNKTLLHFEIRKNGKPVNPLNFLSKKR